jgi:hypothetical protein
LALSSAFSNRPHVPCWDSWELRQAMKARGRHPLHIAFDHAIIRLISMSILQLHPKG